jgi:2-phospho-L-lactate/phosphoenolpyruvate guanylyltransferase
VTLAALVPAKSFGRAKSRLAGVLQADEREQLARACFTRVVDALHATAAFEPVAVCTDGDEVHALASSLGCEVIRDPDAPVRFSEIIDAALLDLARRGATRALVVMADLPEASPDSFIPLLAAREAVVLVPDAEGLGTSALLLPLPAPFATAFGNRDSAARHEALAESSGLTFSRAHVPSLARDVDGPLDLVGRDALFKAR